MQKEARQSVAIQNPYTVMSKRTSGVNIPTRRLCGGRVMISSEAISIPRPIAGKPEVIMIIHKISTGASGKTEMPVSSLKARPIRRVQACAIFSARRCRTNFFRILDSAPRKTFNVKGTSYLLDIIKHAPTFFNRVEDRGKVIIGKNNVRSIFRHITTC